MFSHNKSKKLNLKELFRYQKDKNAFILDISIGYYRDLYNDWDFSPFKRRELDSDLMSYIEEASEEIPLKYNIIINFFMPEEMRDPLKEEKSKTGLKNYFNYMLYKMQGERNKYRRRALNYTLTGLLLVLVVFFIQKYVRQIIYLSIFPEGLVIGGWVFIWEVFTILFFENSERKVKISEYKRLMKSEINYRYYTDENHFEKLKVK